MVETVSILLSIVALYLGYQTDRKLGALTDSVNQRLIAQLGVESNQVDRLISLAEKLAERPDDQTPA